MAVRNSTSRTTTNYIFAKYDGQSFMLTLGSFQTKDILYSTRKKLLGGKIEIPKLEKTANKTTILITCSKQSDGGLKFDLI